MAALRTPFFWLLLALWWPTPARAGGGWRFQTFTTRQGLAQDRVLRLAQDRTGFLWIGTEDGLSRYDGLTFRTFIHRRNQPTTLPANEVNELLPLPDGGLLAGTINGLARYQASTGTFRSQTFRVKGVPTSQVSDVFRLTTDATGHRWIGTAGALLRDNGPGQPPTWFQPARRPGALAAGSNVNFARRGADRSGRLWLGTLEGLHVYDPVTGRFWNHRYNPRQLAALQDSGAIRCFTFDQQGRVWYAIWNEGLRCYDPHTNTVRAFMPDPADSSTLPGRIVNCLVVDRAGVVWCGMYGSGAARLDPVTGRCQRIQARPHDATALPDGYVNDILEDHQGNLWFATDKGLALLSPLSRQFECWPAPPQPGTGQSAELGSICPDAAGRLWLATYSQGLLCFDPTTNQFHRVATPPAPDANGFNTHDLVWALAPAPGGDLWVGTQVGLLRFDPTHERWKPLPPELPDFLRGPPPLPERPEVTSAILTARDGSTWFGTYRHGVVRYDPRTGSVQRFHGADPSGGDTLTAVILDLAEDAAGNIWVAGHHGHGVSRLTAGSWRVRTWHDPQHPGAPGDTDFHCLLPDVGPVAGMWLGTVRAGINHYDARRDAFREVSKGEGLSGTLVHSLTADGRGHVWAGTVNGLSDLDPRTGRIETYGLADGLPEAGFSRGGYFDTARGMLWLTTSSYLIQVQPDRLLRNHQPPPVHLTGLLVNGRSRPLPVPNQTLTLLPGQNALTFEVAALNLLSPQKNQYTWKLEGADPRWSPPTAQRTFTYANLAPGTYTLRVRAANNDGVWNKKGLTLPLRLLPPWYRTWWFYVLTTAAVLGLLYAFYRQRLARAAAVARARNQIARDLHDDIGSTLSSILIQSEVPAATLEQARTRLRKISDYAQPMLLAMDEIVWTVNPQFDPLPAVVYRMRAFAAEALELQGIELDFRATGPLDRLSLSLQRRRDFWLIFKEAVNNVAKYAQATHVQVIIHASLRHLTLEVSDDGRGYDPAAPAQGGGNGLRNQRQRARTLGATLSLESAPGQGTRLRLDVPV